MEHIEALYKLIDTLTVMNAKLVNIVELLLRRDTKPVESDLFSSFMERFMAHIATVDTLKKSLGKYLSTPVPKTPEVENVKVPKRGAGLEDPSQHLIII